MILSRIQKALADQNWLAVTIEFVIVILGVVIGFQVTAWADAHQDRMQERVILVRLLEDFRDLRASEIAYLERAAQQQRLRAQWIRGLEDDEPFDMTRMREMVLDFYETEDPARKSVLETGDPESIFTDPIGGERQPAVSIVFQQLVASGELNLIRSERVRSVLTQRNALRAQAIAAIDRNQSGGNLSRTEAFREPVFQAASPDPEHTLNAAMTNPDFAAGLRTFDGLRSFNEVWYRYVHDETLAVLAILENEATE